MNSHYVVIDIDGLVSAAGFGLPPDGAVVVAGGIPLGDLSTLFVDGESGLVPRPDIEAPALDGSTLTIPACPAGSVIRLEDLIGGDILFIRVAEVGDDPIEITLPDAGRYFALIEPPAPYMPSALEFSL
jgi:hypothetical protein